MWDQLRRRIVTYEPVFYTLGIEFAKSTGRNENSFTKILII